MSNVIIPEDVLKEIDKQAWRFVQVQPSREIAINAVKYGYSLAQEEIEKAIELLRKEYFSSRVYNLITYCNYSKDEANAAIELHWQQFKQTHQL